jgi:uncharacterized membrane protein
LEVLLILLGLSIPIAGIAAFFMALGARGRLRLVETRLAALEAGFPLPGAAAPAAAAAQPPPAQPIAEPLPEGELPPETIAEPAIAAMDSAGGEAVPEAAAEAAATPETVASPALPPITPAPPLPAGESLEERFGTRWVVWVGGIALALGGVFLVKYSIEQGLIGPGMRVFLGGLFAAALVAAGEWARRRGQALASVPAADIPSILTAAGTTVAYATVYAAYALYGFLSPGLAFPLLGAVALATLAAALLHGPALAGLGVVGAYVTPLLVASNAPNYWALVIYLAVVTAAAFALARARLWRWLALTAIAAGFLWMLPGIDARDYLGPHVFHAVTGFALVAALIVSGLLFGPDAAPGRIDGVSSIGIGLYVVAAGLLVVAQRHDPVALAAFTLLVVATVAIAWRAESAAGAVPVAAALSALVIVHWVVQREVGSLLLPAGPVAGDVADPSGAFTGGHLALGAFYAALFAIAGYLAQGRSERAVVPILWAASAVLAPIAIVIALYYRISGFERSIPFAGIALLMAALYGYATELLARREPGPGMAAATALFATGTVAALALAFTFALEKGWLTVGLALMVPGIAYVADKRPLPMLRVLAAAIGMIVLARVGWEPRIVGPDLGTRPVVNWILYGYGVPALAFWVAGFLLRRRADDGPARIVDGLAILFTVLLANLEIRHYVHGGDIYGQTTVLAEVAMQVSVWLAMALALERLRVRTGSVVHDVGAMFMAALALAGIVFGLWINENPMATGEPVGGRFFNLILLGYGLPAVLAIVLALNVRGTRPMPYRVVAVVVSVALALTYLSLEVRRLFHGPDLTEGLTSDAEQYTYSAVWLVFGVVLLLVGIALRSQPARLASAAVILLTIAKVFLIDMAGITGVFRALSFIGLGLVLVGIGSLYQRLLFPKRPGAPPPAAPPAPPPSGPASPDAPPEGSALATSAT